MGTFLYIEGVTGSATEVDHKGEIELTSAVFPGDKPGGSVNYRELTATKKQDRASTALLKAATSGEIFGFMIIDVVSPGYTKRVTMGMVMFSSLSSSRGIESFGLDFETYSVEYLG